MSGGGGNVIGDAAVQIVLVIGVIIIIILAIGIFLLVKAVNCIVRAFVKCQGKSKALWLALIVFCVSAGLLIVVSLTQLPQDLATLAEIAVGVSFAGLVITARVVELSLEETFERQQGNLVDEIMHRRWWNMNDTRSKKEEAGSVAPLEALAA